MNLPIFLRITLSVLILSTLLACNNSSGGTYIECGGPQQFPCPTGMYCRLAQDCGGLDGSGTCRPIPVDCPNEDKPVCGCDKRTYASMCYAEASLQSVAYEGECISTKGPSRLK